ncbi:hypothetical protein Tco_0411331 [Tanacetum coccineum]
MLAIWNAVEPVAFQALNSFAYLKKKKKSSSAKDSNLSQPLASTPVVSELHKEDLQASSGLASLEVTGQNQHLLVKVVTVHSKSRIGKGSKLFEKDILLTEEEFNTSPDLSSSDDATKEIKLEDLTKLIPNMEVDFMDLDLPDDDAPIIVQDDDAKEVHAEQHKETEDASASHPLSLKTVQIQELNKQVHLLQTLNSKLVKEKELAKTKAALLKEKPSFLNVEQLTELLEIHTKLEKFTSTVSGLTTQVSKLRTLQWDFQLNFLLYQGKFHLFRPLKTLDALPSLITKVTDALDMFTQAIESASHKAGN